MEQHDDQGLAAVSCLDDPVRRRLYEFVAGQSEPVGRDEAAAATSIGRPLAAYHLDKLVGLGLLTASFQRPAGRTGPGAGRPAKVYARSRSEFTFSVPPRDYELAARLLAAAVEADSGGMSRVALQRAARRFGASLTPPSQAAGGAAAPAEPANAALPAEPANAAVPAEPANAALPAEPAKATVPAEQRARPEAAAAVQGVLRAHGYEPWREADGTIRLRNCPFHQLAAEHREVVCGMNLALIEGLVAGLATSELQPSLEPRPDSCCVAIGTGGQAAEKTGES